MQSLWIEADVGPDDVENGGSDERIFDEERIEERGGVYDEVPEKDATAARDVARQFPQTRPFFGFDDRNDSFGHSVVHWIVIIE